MSSHGVRGLRHKSLPKRRQAWNERLETVGLTITECRDRWRKLPLQTRRAMITSRLERTAR